jgi:mRNA interferase RelE/StbE
MTEYSVQLVASAAKEFRALPTDMKHKVGSAVEAISKNPRPAGVRRLHGHERLYRIRVGHYRIVYEIDDQSRIILITRIRHRREAYR